jgi:hypothetical protein
MRLRYDLATHVDFNVNIKFYYVNESEQFIFHRNGGTPPSPRVGGKSKHKSYRRKRQQRRSHGHKRTRIRVPKPQYRV